MGVQEYLEMFIQQSFAKGQTLILEGEHLEPEFNEKMLAKYGDQCICFIITCENMDTLMLRFKARAQEFSLNPAKNKYLKDFEGICEI